MSALPPKADIGTTGIYEYGSCHKAHNFFGTKSEKGRPRFFARGPRDVRDGRWSETLSRFANAGPRDVRDGRWSDGRRARGWSRLTSRSLTADPETLLMVTILA